jgi:hypothetical protein
MYVRTHGRPSAQECRLRLKRPYPIGSRAFEPYAYFTRRADSPADNDEPANHRDWQMPAK